jgi:hypothetical protein
VGVAVKGEFSGVVKKKSGSAWQWLAAPGIAWQHFGPRPGFRPKTDAIVPHAKSRQSVSELFFAR